MDAQALALMQEQVVAAYEQQGFSSELIGGWAISENDVADLVATAEAAQPRKILEVGTYVGVSTMMLAMACPEAEIFTVDPNFELAREMRAVNAGAAVEDNTPKQHDIARRAAEILGIADRIHFVEGGFSVGDTFTSLLDDTGATTPVIGPELCKTHGPFDLVFIDGLHTPDAVLKDLQLAASALTPNAVMMLHDCIGFWGASVRRGVMAFLRDNPEFNFSHPPYADVYRSVGIVSRREDATKTRAPGPTAPALSRTVAAFARTALGGGQILEVAIGKPWLEVTPGALDPIKLTAKAASANKSPPKLAKAIDEHPDAGILALDAADFASDAVLSHVFLSAKDVGRAVFMGFTPPGETGVAGRLSRPLARLVDLADASGMSLFLFPFTDQEHARYALLPETRELGLSSLFLTFLVAAPGNEYIDAAGRRYIRLNDELALDREQEALQRVHVACSYRMYFDRANTEQRTRLSAVESLSTQINEIHHAYERDTGELRAEIGHANAATERIQDIRTALRTELDTAYENVGKLETRLQVIASDAETRAAEVNALSSQASALIAEKDALSLERDALAVERETLRSEVSTLTLQRSSLSQQLIDVFTVFGTIEEQTRWDEALLGIVQPEKTHSDIAPETDEQVKEEAQALLRRTVAVSAANRQLMTYLQTDNAALRGELERIRRSVSWRVMGPYRVVRRAAANLLPGE